MRRWIHWLPGIKTLRRYEAAWLRHDIFAGLRPGDDAGPGWNCLRSSIGLARHLRSVRNDRTAAGLRVVRPQPYPRAGTRTSALAAVILGVVVPLSGGDPLRAATLAAMMAIVSGTVCILAGIARLGFVTELLSKPIRYGYMNGIALTVLISQLPKLFGFSIESGGPLRSLWAIVDAILEGKTNWVAFGIGLGTLTIILLLQNNKRLPSILIAIVAATAFVGVFGLAARYGVAVLGPLPEGLPGFVNPLDHLRRYRPGIGRRLRYCAGFVCRHQRAFACLCRSIGHPCRSQPGDGGAWRRQSGNRLFSRLPDQQQRFAHAGCRSRRRSHPTDQRRWCA